MQVYFVSNLEKDRDYVVVPGRVALEVTPKILTEFLYGSSFEGWEDSSVVDKPVSAETLGQIVATRDGDVLKIANQEVWEERRELYGDF
jgi:hypothetical protein